MAADEVHEQTGATIKKLDDPTTQILKAIQLLNKRIDVLETTITSQAELVARNVVQEILGKNQSGAHTPLPIRIMLTGEGNLPITVKGKNLVVVGQEHGSVDQRLKKLEILIQEMKMKNVIDANMLCPFPEVKLPNGFKFPNMDIYNGIGCPRIHIRMYIGHLKPLGIGDELLLQLFQRSLTGDALNWLMKTDPVKVSTWADMVNAFVNHFSYNTDIPFFKPHLELVKQGHHESFSGYITRWRAKALEILDRLSEKEQVDMAMQNLNDEYFSRLSRTYHDTFHSFVKAGMQIEDALATGKITKFVEEIECEQEAMEDEVDDQNQNQE